MTVLTVLSCLFVLSGILSALAIACDLRSHPQSMRIMYSVWILTGLWAGLPGLWAYFRFGRELRRDAGMRMPTGRDTNEMAEQADSPAEMKAQNPVAGTDHGYRHVVHHEPNAGDLPNEAPDDMAMSRHMQMEGMVPPQRPHWQSVVLSTLHCGAGCTLADLIGEWALFFLPVAVAGSYLAGSWIVDYVLALVLGVYFQYAAIRHMQRIPRRRAALNALKADFLSLTAWQAGMYAWMAFVLFALRGGVMLPRTSWAFWFMMQLAMYVGFLLSLPVNAWLIRRHIKHAM